MNDLTIFLDVCRNTIPDFKGYVHQERWLWSSSPYKEAQMLVKEEYWDKYIEAAVNIAYSCKSESELLQKIRELNVSIARDWYDPDILL